VVYLNIDVNPIRETPPLHTTTLPHTYLGATEGMLEISNSLVDVRRVEVMVRVIMMGMIVVFVVIAPSEGPALHNRGGST
jgi:hypothetical protein